MWTKVKFLTACSIALSFLFSSCDPSALRGKGDLLTETRNVSDFHGLEVNTSGIVEVRKDSVFKVEVTCEESIISSLETNESGGILKIYFDHTVYDVDGLKIRISAPNMDAFELTGSADVRVLDDISGNTLDLDVSGSGNIDLSDVDFDNIKASVSGSGDVEITGQANDLDASISGSGSVDALYCPVKTAKVNISGSGDAVLDVSDLLDVSVSGSGSVRYKGNPTLHSSISGSGSVKKL